MSEALNILKISKTKRNLLIHVIQLLSNNLWSDITLEDIERHLCKTRGAIFHHFKTKEELFTHAILYFIAHITNVLEHTPDSSLETILECLESEFKIENPRNGFFNLVLQAKYKNIKAINNIFSYINEVNITKEQNTIGKKFINMCCSWS